MFLKNLDNNTRRGIALYINKALKADEVDLNTKFDEFISVEVPLVKVDTLLIVQITNQTVEPKKTENFS